MKIARKIFIALLTVVLAIGTSIPASTKSLSTTKTATTIDYQLQAILEDAKNTDKIPVDIWLHETITEAVKETKVFTEIGFNKSTILADAKGNISNEKVDEYIQTKRTLYARERTDQYVAFRADYSNIQGLQETQKSSTTLFYSQYAPMISAELSPMEIKRIANDCRVQTIYYSPRVTLTPSSDISIQSIRADYTRDTLNVSGTGIKIGLLEAEGLPNPNLIASSIEYDSNVSLSYNQHASIVASIMCGASTTIDGITYEGIVPDASLYATHCGLGGHANWRAAVEWLLSEKVHVINMSANFDYINTNYYGPNEKWLDHIAINHNVHFVNSAGNSSMDRQIRGPGMAYNILTVGAIDDHNTNDSTSEISDDSLATFSGYVEAVSMENENELHPTNKPDLVAPGVDINTPAYYGENISDKSGTSYAAPHITAVVAQLCQRRPTLKVQQDAVKAILTASIPHTEHRYVPTNLNYDKYGAGVVDAQSAYYVTDNYRFRIGTFAANETDGATKTYTFEVFPSDETIRISLSWLKYAYISENHVDDNPNHDAPLADLDLYVYGPDGEPRGTSAQYYNNTEIIEIPEVEPGIYTIVIEQYIPSDRAVYFAVAWW